MDNGHPHAARWAAPADTRPALCVYNSLTRTKTPFATHTPNVVRWYNCGPTVYDAAHIGHARNYVTFDALRRILEGHFGYAVSLVMNITDIDDKIIVRARQAHLLAEYAAKWTERSAAMDADVSRRLSSFAMEHFGLPACTPASLAAVALPPGDDESAAKRAMRLAHAKRAADALADASLSAAAVIGASGDIVAPSLDAECGASVTAHSIFAELARFWEADFHADMAALGVQPPTALTRVSEFVPEVVAFVERVIAKGFAYVADGSVYFSVAAFEAGGGDHSRVYARLCPWSAASAALRDEGEGALGATLAGKRDGRDFCLWKASRAGEPAWPSPWGPGRPGWHIECSAMAAAVAPGPLDVHSGGIDLAFPHHDNECAQAEAYFAGEDALPAGQWVSYFLHAGHVHVEGLKMSKSLKNFVSIKDALARHSPRVLRLFFLSHPWSSGLTYRDDAVASFAGVDATLVQFFATAEAVLRSAGTGAPGWTAADKELLVAVHACAQDVHAAFCDSFDTPSALAAAQALVARVHMYLRTGAPPNTHLLRTAVDRVAKTLSVMGLDYGAGTSDAGCEDRLAEAMGVAAAFRDAVRSVATALVPDARKTLLGLTDTVRAQLHAHGVLLEDQRDGPTLVKLVSKAEAARLSSAAASAEAEKTARRMEALRLEAERVAARKAKAALEPGALLAGYGAYDAEGMPTHAADGTELSKSARKRIARDHAEQVKLHASFLAGDI